MERRAVGTSRQDVQRAPVASSYRRSKTEWRLPLLLMVCPRSLSGARGRVSGRRVHDMAPKRCRWCTAEQKARAVRGEGGEWGGQPFGYGAALVLVSCKHHPPVLGTRGQHGLEKGRGCSKRWMADAQVLVAAASSSCVLRSTELLLACRGPRRAGSFVTRPAIHRLHKAAGRQRSLRQSFNRALATTSGKMNCTVFQRQLTVKSTHEPQGRPRCVSKKRAYERQTKNGPDIQSNQIRTATREW